MLAVLLVLGPLVELKGRRICRKGNGHKVQAYCPGHTPQISGLSVNSVWKLFVVRNVSHV